MIELSKAEKAARYFGAEAECNGLPMSEYRDSIADYYGRGSWQEMTPEEKQSATKQFQIGREEEKKVR